MKKENIEPIPKQQILGQPISDSHYKMILILA